MAALPKGAHSIRANHPDFDRLEAYRARYQDFFGAEALARQWAGEQRVDAIVSTDGDADRSLIPDASGTFLRGDLIGAITAKSLGADAIVTPVTSNSALESGGFRMVTRTPVGSPYVIEGIAEASRFGTRTVVGFEVNRGVLLGSDIQRGGGSSKLGGGSPEPKFC